MPALKRPPDSYSRYYSLPPEYQFDTQAIVAGLNAAPEMEQRPCRYTDVVILGTLRPCARLQPKTGIGVMLVERGGTPVNLTSVLGVLLAYKFLRELEEKGRRVLTQPEQA